MKKFIYPIEEKRVIGLYDDSEVIDTSISFVLVSCETFNREVTVTVKGEKVKIPYLQAISKNSTSCEIPHFKYYDVEKDKMVDITASKMETAIAVINREYHDKFGMFFELKEFPSPDGKGITFKLLKHESKDFVLVDIVQKKKQNKAKKTEEEKFTAYLEKSTLSVEVMEKLFKEFKASKGIAE